MDDLSAYDYHLPPELIAARPAAVRDEARLLVVDRRTGSIAHRTIRDLPSLLKRGDRLVLNDTRVLPARLFGIRVGTGGRWEGLYLGCDDRGDWRMLSQTRGKLQAGEIILIPVPRTASNAATHDEERPLKLVLREKGDEGIWRAQPMIEASPLELLDRFGTMPLPPYIRRLATEEDAQRYQTTFAKVPGAVAAPTAGLHFTPELLAACRERGIEQTHVTLHVGIGTFRPISVERLSEHRMHAEWCDLSAEAAEAINRTRQCGGRIIAVGTTSVRTLESAAADGSIAEWRGETNLFIRPPYEFRVVDCLLTNFHLPKSTLLVLVSAFADRDLIREAYATAIAERYRFYSYGDAMLVV